MSMTRCPVDDAGVVDSDVQLPVALEHELSHLVDRLGIAHVDARGMDVGSGFGQPGRHRAQSVLVNVGHDDPHALGHECFDHGQSDAAGRPGHHGHLPLQVLHAART
jgi:hypothetical protein